MNFEEFKKIMSAEVGSVSISSMDHEIGKPVPLDDYLDEYNHWMFLYENLRDDKYKDKADTVMRDIHERFAPQIIGRY